MTDKNDAFSAEIVPPTTTAAVGSAGRLLTRGQVAQRLGLSLSSVRRMEGVQLKPIVGERGVRYFEETEIQTVLVRVRRTRVPDDDRANGALAAAAFTLFRNGADVVAVVTELREAPAKIEELFERWKRLRGTILLDAKSLAALAGALGTSNPTDESALLAAVAEFKKSTGQQCVLCEREPAYWCRGCAQEAGRADAREREARKLF
jgi:Tfp pilus assembly protein FimV